ncbi:MAG TPA: hypothetical protein VMG08_07140 [Allosphingosinicella sp.]|nr:hypothetical protein [Allosphingosinicella sp.]
MTGGQDLNARAERLSRRRARLLPVLAVLYLGQQISYFAEPSGAGGRAVDYVKVSAWLVLSVVLLALLITKGFWFHGRAVRDLIDDENTRANRHDALRVGFVAAMLTGIFLYFLDQFEPMPARHAVHAIMSLGLGAALIRFGMLERRAHREG